MTEREVAFGAVLVAAAAAGAMPISWWAVAAALCLVLATRHPVAVIVVLCLVVSTRAAAAEQGLARASAQIHGVAMLVSDPEQRLGGVIADVRIDGSRFRATFTGDAARVVAPAAMGHEVTLAGRIQPLPGRWSWRASKHLAGALMVQRVEATNRGAWWWRAVNSFREVIADGTTSLSADHRALFDGIVLGDDRAQSDLARHRFRAAGLSHLLAVSGQNVAFALLAVSPLLRRCSLKWRWIGSMVVLAGFVLLTRLEPSVLRAACMAAVAVSAAWWGRMSSGFRTLALAVIVLLVVDPLLVWSSGFRLSVAATAALVWCSRPLADSLHDSLTGPAWLTGSLGVSLAAQLGTAVLLVAIAGTVPMMGPVVNVAAVPVAGWLMVWGLVSAPIAGVLGGPIATALCWPTRVLLWVLDRIAEGGAWSSWPRLGWPGAIAMSIVIAVAAARAHIGARPWLRRWGVTVAVLGAAVMVVDALLGAPEASPPRTVFAERGVRVWRHGGATVMALDAQATSRTALDALLRARVTGLDLVVVTGGGLRTSAVVFDLRQATTVGVVLADPAKVRHAVALRAGPVTAGELRLEVRRLDGRWRVDAAGTATRGPPLGSGS